MPDGMSGGESSPAPWPALSGRKGLCLRDADHRLSTPPRVRSGQASQGEGEVEEEAGSCEIQAPPGRGLPNRQDVRSSGREG